MSPIERCAFVTERLLVRDWHSPPGEDWPRHDLGIIVSDLMTEPVTQHLPDGWRGPFSPSRARAWVAERDDESPTLLVVDRAAKEPVGLVVVYESADAVGGLDVRLGYLLIERAWGKGLATELLTGFVDWCRPQPAIHSITAGVAATNEASRRVLERLGFIPLEDTDPDENARADAGAEGADGQLVYRLRIDG